jgi:hypothetical protein
MNGWVTLETMIKALRDNELKVLDAYHEKNPSPFARSCWFCETMYTSPRKGCRNSSGFVWICLDLSGCPDIQRLDIRISSECPDIQSGYVRICLDTLV